MTVSPGEKSKDSLFNRFDNLTFPVSMSGPLTFDTFPVLTNWLGKLDLALSQGQLSSAREKVLWNYCLTNAD
ncbi:unnamed protein product [Macrosiphum euphorbiae]|nr:unnamed protein product [Macrosiphum euphorbiae]